MEGIKEAETEREVRKRGTGRDGWRRQGQRKEMKVGGKRARRLEGM